MATGLLTKGITLGYKTTAEGASYTLIDALQSAPAIGGAAEQVDVTCLADGNYRYINGIKDFGTLEFTFLYDNSSATSNYRVVRGLEDAESVVYWEVTYPDETKFQFSGQVSTATSEAEVNAAITFTATVNLNSSITVVNPA